MIWPTWRGFCPSCKASRIEGAAVLDDKLAATLRAFLVEGKAASQLFEGPNAPIGTFSARTDACFALALIDEDEHAEISLIRKVRNEFAHGLHGTTFQHERIAGYCSGLRSPLPEGADYPTSKPRLRFTNSVISLVTRLYYGPSGLAASAAPSSSGLIRNRCGGDRSTPSGRRRAPPF